MGGKGQASQGGLMARIRGRGRKIRGRHEGPVRSGGRVTVESDATVLGDVMAPQVVARGQIRGRVISGSLTVKEGGQVWGDVWTESVRQKPGGTIRGWISPLTAPLMDALESDAPIPSDLGPSPGEGDGSTAHAASLELLRAELYEALLARKSVERQLADLVLETTPSREAAGGGAAGVPEERERVLAGAVRHAQDEAENLEREVSELEAALSEMTGRRDGAVAQGVERQRTIDAVTAELERRQGRIARLIDDLTNANQVSGERQREIDRLAAEVAQAHGKFASTIVSRKTIDESLALGYRFVAMGDDVLAICQHCKSVLAEFASRGILQPPGGDAGWMFDAM